MVYSLWLGTFGWGVFFIGLIVAIVLYANLRKFYPVLYLVSIATYIFIVGFVIDIFDLGKNGILGMLALSAVIFIGLGAYFSAKVKHRKEEFENTIPKKR